MVLNYFPAWALNLETIPVLESFVVLTNLFWGLNVPDTGIMYDGTSFRKPKEL